MTKRWGERAIALCIIDSLDAQAPVASVVRQVVNASAWVFPALSLQLTNLHTNGPGTFRFNVGLSRRFRFTETRAVRFRREAFHLTNHVNFGLPQTDVDVSNGAAISLANAPPRMRMRLRVAF